LESPFRGGQGVSESGIVDILEGGEGFNALADEGYRFPLAEVGSVEGAEADFVVFP